MSRFSLVVKSIGVIALTAGILISCKGKSEQKGEMETATKEAEARPSLMAIRFRLNTRVTVKIYRSR
jgi:hypothetical protein